MILRFIDRQLAAETVAQAQRRIVRRKLVNADVRFGWWCPPSLAPRSVFASCLARSPSWRGLTRRHTEKNTRDPVCLARSTCLYLQPTGDRMVTPLPTESQRYREYGLLKRQSSFILFGTIIDYLRPWGGNLANFSANFEPSIGLRRLNFIPGWPPYS